MSVTERDAATIGTASVVNGELVVSWVNGVDELFSPQDREFSEGEPLPYHTFLLWLDEERAPTHVEIPAVSLSAAISALEGWLVERSLPVRRVTFINRSPRRADELGRTPYVRTVGGYAPLAA